MTDATTTGKALLDQRIQGITKLDQQLVYVPLAALAAAVYAVGAHRGDFQVTQMASWVPNIHWVVFAVVGAGLFRNHYRHTQFSSRRHELDGTSWTRGDRLAHAGGRLIYFILFGVGWTVGSVALYRLLAW